MHAKYIRPVCESFALTIFQNLYNFLAQPNVLEHLDISNTDTALESVSNFLPLSHYILCYINIFRSFLVLYYVVVQLIYVI